LTKGCEESKTMMEDNLDGSSNFKVIERKEFIGILIVGNTKGFTRDNYQ
jgi:hypothetical protein